MNEERRTYETVDELSARIRGIVEESGLFSNVVVRGEATGVKIHTSGVYFDLKGETSLISAVIWKSVYYRLGKAPEEGKEIICRGELSYYPARGRLNFKVYSFEEVGQGKKNESLKLLYEKLKKEGIFDREKKELPHFPSKVALVCGYRSAAESDVTKNLPRRWPLSEILLFPTLVQGERAPASIVAALDRADRSDAEVVIMARGGGSSDDLSSFNDETVVRKVASMRKPIVSAVGHEIDVALTDFAADRRASTPTAAAEVTVPDIGEIYGILEGCRERLNGSLKTKFLAYRRRVDVLKEKEILKSPLSSYKAVSERLASFGKRLDSAYSSTLLRRRSALDSLKGRFEAYSYQKTLERGFAYLVDENGKPVTGVGEARLGEKLEAHLRDGIIVTKIEGVTEDGK